MNWEGFKRQRSIGQLMFESLPQFVLQLVFIDLLTADGESKISGSQLFFSIGSAFCNILTTSAKLKMESLCCKTDVISYALICIQVESLWESECNVR